MLRRLQLTYWPLLQVQSVVQIYPIGQNNPLTVNVDYSVDLNKGWLTRLNPFTDVAVTWESLPTVIIYSAGYGVQVSEQQTIPAMPGPYTLAATNAATFAFDDGVTYKTIGNGIYPHHGIARICRSICSRSGNGHLYV